MNDINTAAEIQHDLRQSDADQVNAEIEEQLTIESEALIGSEDGMAELLSQKDVDVIPNLLSILSCGRRTGDIFRAVDKMHDYLLELAKDMLRDEVTARVMEERECVEYGYED